MLLSSLRRLESYKEPKRLDLGRFTIEIQRAEEITPIIKSLEYALKSCINKKN